MMTRELLAGAVALGLSVVGCWAVAQASQGQKGGTAYDYALTAIDGTPMPIANYLGKVLLLVNTASFRGFTPQYEGLEQLQTPYTPRGFTGRGVTAGNFLGTVSKRKQEIS